MSEAPQNQTAPKTPLGRSVRAFSQQQPEKKERIPTWMAVCMIIVALCVDGAQVLLTILVVGVVLGPVLSVAAYVAFGIWFMMLGVSFTGFKKIGTAGGSVLLESVLSFLPAFTLAVAVFILMTMAEDKGGMLGKVAGMAQGKMTGIVQGAQPAGFARQDGGIKRFQPKISGPNKTESKPVQKTSPEPIPDNVKQFPPQTAPQIASVSSHAVYKQPDWMRDKSVDEAMKFRKQRADVADRLGMSKEQSAKHILDAENKDYTRRRAA